MTFEMNDYATIFVFLRPNRMRRSPRVDLPIILQVSTVIGSSTAINFPVSFEVKLKTTLTTPVALSSTGIVAPGAERVATH